MRYRPAAQRPEGRLLALLPILAILFPGPPEPGAVSGARPGLGPASPPDPLHAQTSPSVILPGREDQTPTPPVTILYQNFPNPFPSPEVGGGETRIWFDLARRSRVDLAIFDVRGRQVRRLIPAHDCGPQELPPGIYGRDGNPSADPCVRLSWDGRDEAGRTLPRGVYLLRLEAGGTVDVRRVVFWP